MTKQYTQVKDEDTRKALVELQPLVGNRTRLTARRTPDFLTEGDRIFVCFEAGSKDWREIKLV